MQKNNWKKCKLEDVADIVGGGTPSTKNPSYWNGNIPWLTPKDLSGYYARYISCGERNISDEGLNNSSAILLPTSSVLLTSRAPIGYVAIARNAIATNQGFKSLILKKGQYPLFYYYLLKANVEYIQHMGSGSTFKEVSGKVVKELEFFIPEYEEQKRIAEILGAFDDKIELLQKQNKTLENMAKALFKCWFVDFSVVRAKASLATRRNLSPLRGKCHNVAKGGPNKPNSSCALVSTHQIYTKSVKNLVRAMRQNLTPQEVKLWQYLRKEQLGVKFRRQFPIDSKYIADFACLEKKLIIELDGTQHAENQHDKERTLYLEDNGFTVLRFWNNEIDKNLIGCLERIREFLNYPPLPAYEEKGADNAPLPACGVLSPQGGQKTAWTKERIMREYHLTEELYNLFPSSFVDSPLGPIPSGWEVKTAGEIIDFSIGGGWGNDTETAEFSIKAPVIRGTDIPTLRSTGNTSNVPIRFHKKSNHTSRQLQYGDIVLEVAGGSKGQPVGRSLFVDSYILGALTQVICASFCKLLRANGDVLLPELFYLYLDQMYQTKEIEQYQVQSTGISNFQFKQFCEEKTFVVPPISIQKAFPIAFCIDKIENNKTQIQTLTELRDSLLPRLISGKIRV